MQDHKDLTLDEFNEGIKKNDPNAILSQAKVSGFVRIIDKDGNLKAELPITTIEVNEEKTNGN